MAGETTKSTLKTALDAGSIIDARVLRGTMHVSSDVLTYSAATELEAADTRQTVIQMPSNAILLEVMARHGDLDTHACAATLVVDMGLYATEAFTSVTGGTKTRHAKNAALSTDAIVDGDTTFRAAVATLTAKALDPTNFAAGQGHKALWEILGYDTDPHTTLGVSVTSQAASAALSSAASVDLVVKYVTD